jgi:apolipoprotein N-acyltransferase
MGIPLREYYNDPDAAPNDARVSKSGKKWDSFNSVILLEPGKKNEEFTTHKKVKLVPFSERVPYQEIFPFAEKLVNWGVGISHWQRGKELNLFELENKTLKPRAKFEAIICFESVFSELVSEGVNGGAEFIAIVTNDGWWGNTAGPYQHEQYAVLRAIENRKWVIRCAQTGISCFIDPLGNINDEINYFTEGVKTRDIIANTEKTFYSENGDIAGKVSLFVSTISLMFVLFLYLKRKIK